MSLVSGSAAPYIATDQILVDQIVYELKSQGIFDSFRKECIADVDTKPAYQNLRQRVEGSVGSFLKEQKWKPESNKNQLREMLRKNIYESGFLETGVERIVNQVVNPKINTVFLPKVKEVFYKYIGLQTTPAITEENSYNVDTMPKMEDEPNTQNILPTHLEAISPENDNVDKVATEDSNSMAIDDDDTSPPFEPIDEDLSFKLIPADDNSIDSHLSGMSGLASHNSQQNDKDKMVAVQHLLESDSQVSKNSSSDDRLSIVTDEASNAKLDILVDNDGVVGAMETTKTSEDNEDSKNEKLTNLAVGEIFQESKDNHDNKDKVTIDESVTEDSMNLKTSEETSNIQIKDEIVEDSKVTLSSETLDSTIKLDAVDSTAKHISSHKKDVSRDHKKDTSRHHNSSKSRDKSKDYRESNSKSSKSKSSTKDRDKDSKSKSNSSSNRHSSDKDKEYSSIKRHSSSSSKDKDKNNSGSTKDKTSSSKDKDKNIATSSSKDKEVSSRYKESSKDHSAGKSSTSSSRDKSSSKDHSKDGKSKSTSSADKSSKSEHRSSSSRKYSSSHTTRDDSSKSQISSNTNKDKRDKKDNSIKDDHFCSKTQRTDSRSTDRDSNDGQTKNKGSSACNDGTTLFLKSEEQRSNNNTTEDSSSSNTNSKDGSNSDCCQIGDETTKRVPDEIQVKDTQTEICDNLQPIVATAMKDLQNYTETKLDENEEKNNSSPLVSPLIESSEVLKSNVPDFVETLDAIKSHLAQYKLDDQNDKMLPIIKLPKFASNFREARKIMKLRKQLKKQSKLRKIMIKGNSISTDSERIELGSIEECPNRESSETLNAVVHIENTDDNKSDTSLALLEQDLSNDATIIKTMENVNTDKAMIKTNSNDDCLYLDKISEKTTRYLNYTSSFIETLNKEISAPQIKGVNKKRKVQKRKISTISSDSSINNDNNPEHSFPNFKVSTSAADCNITSPDIPATKGDVVPMTSNGAAAGVTSATAHVHVVKQRRLNNSKATQRYTSDDLYKPRPFLKGTTKRTSGRVAN